MHAFDTLSGTCPSQPPGDLSRGCPLPLPEDAAETRPARGLRRVGLLALGCLSTALGVAGIFLPLLPTTCFLLSAAWCFARSSPRFHAWLHENRWFGSYLTRYREDRAVPAGLKRGSLTFLWASLGLSAALLTPPAWVLLLLLGVGLSVTLHVARLETCTAV